MDTQLTLPIKMNKTVKNAVLELNKINKDFKLYEEQYKFKKDELQGIIKKYASDNHVEEFNVVSKGVNLKVRPIVNKKIIWDFDKLESKVDKSLLKQFVLKEYVIEDFDGLIKYLKSCGVNPKKFKEFLKVNKKVDSKALDQLYDLGEIEFEDVCECYKVEITSGYVKISELEE